MKDTVSISKITPAGGNYRMMLSNRDEPLVVSASLYHRHRLKEGIVLTAAQLDQLMAEVETEACKREVNRLLALREHSSGEIKVKLARKQFPRDLADKIVRRYVKNGLLDDARFAADLARRTLDRKPAGRPYLVAFLRRKQIGRELAGQAVDNLLAEKDETALALAALERKWPRPGEFDVETLRTKAYNYLSRRGFGYAAAKAAVDRLIAGAKEVTED